jgi:hypothetical protein
MKNFPFELQVCIQRRPHMRDENLEYMLHLGQHVLRQVFDEERVDDTITEIELFYPERWMNIVEERSLYKRLERFCPNLKKVRIVTQSVYIIQCTPSSSCFIVKSEDEQQREKNERGLTQESETGRLWYQNCFVRDFSKLQVL